MWRRRIYYPILLKCPANYAGNTAEHMIIFTSVKKYFVLLFCLTKVAARIRRNIESLDELHARLRRMEFVHGR